MLDQLLPLSYSPPIPPFIPNNMVATRKRDYDDVDAGDEAAKRQKTSPSTQKAGGGETDQQTAPSDDGSNLISPAGSLASEADVDDEWSDVEWDAASKRLVGVSREAKYDRIYRGMKTDFPDYVFISESDEEGPEMEPTKGLIGTNKILNGALDEVADYYQMRGVMQQLVDVYRKKQQIRSNVSHPDFVRHSDSQAALMDFAYWSGDEAIDYPSITMKVEDEAGNKYTATIKKLKLGP